MGSVISRGKTRQTWRSALRSAIFLRFPFPMILSPPLPSARREPKEWDTEDGVPIREGEAADRSGVPFLQGFHFIKAARPSLQP